jgi:hypothetical protein
MLELPEHICCKHGERCGVPHSALSQCPDPVERVFRNSHCPACATKKAIEELLDDAQRFAIDVLEQGRVCLGLLQWMTKVKAEMNID